jgi:hypothetical protein
LFRNFDDAFVAQMRPHIEKLMEDREPGTRETSQRCVAEIVAALIRSSKHWDFDRVRCSVVTQTKRVERDLKTVYYCVPER